jgi:hypothetical protein
MGDHILFLVFGIRMQREIFDSKRNKLSLGILDCYIMMNFMIVYVTYYNTTVTSEMMKWAWHVAWMDDARKI